MSLRRLTHSLHAQINVMSAAQRNYERRKRLRAAAAAAASTSAVPERAIIVAEGVTHRRRTEFDDD